MGVESKKRGAYEDVRAVRRGDDGDADELLDAVDLVQEAREHALVRARAVGRRARRAERVDLVLCGREEGFGAASAGDVRRRRWRARRRVLS